LATRRTPAFAAISTTMRFASAPVSAQWTLTPFSVSRSSKVRSESPRCRSSSSFAWRARSRTVSTSSSVASAAERRRPNWAVVRSSATRSCGSAIAARPDR